MYFAIIGNHPQIALQELQGIKTDNVSFLPKFDGKNANLLTFQTTEIEKLPNIASFIKRGKIIKKSEL
jgi:hypothetical protein